ncbi:hypothetical protein [uncultured Planktosalinus sp.]|uniref:hypothetical protein n=1 Tax=uncultured Planktosalinus sp. TaxID=1810935 RepID=UPI0030D7E190
MKKIALILGVVTLLMWVYSCTPQSMEPLNPVSCCGDDGYMPPPPPPPPPGDGKG